MVSSPWKISCTSTRTPSRWWCPNGPTTWPETATPRAPCATWSPVSWWRPGGRKGNARCLEGTWRIATPKKGDRKVNWVIIGSIYGGELFVCFLGVAILKGHLDEKVLRFVKTSQSLQFIYLSRCQSGWLQLALFGFVQNMETRTHSGCKKNPAPVGRQFIPPKKHHFSIFWPCVTVTNRYH